MEGRIGGQASKNVVVGSAFVLEGPTIFSAAGTSNSALADRRKSTRRGQLTAAGASGGLASADGHSGTLSTFFTDTCTAGGNRPANRQNTRRGASPLWFIMVRGFERVRKP